MMIRRFILVAIIFVVLTPSTFMAQAPDVSARLTTDNYLDFERVNDAQISPDGAHIVYTRQHVDQVNDKWESELWIMDGDGSHHRFFVKGSGPRWASDSKRILYLSEGEPKGTQIYVRWIDIDGPATQSTHVNETPRNPRWSPDGKSIAFTMFVPENNTWSISMPPEPKGAKWTPAPRIAETLHFRQDQIGFIDDGHNHLFVVPAEGGTPKQLTSGKWSVGGAAFELPAPASIDWTPDSKSIVFDGNRDPDAERQYEISRLYIVDVASGAVRDLVSKPGSWTRPRVSPDGRLVAFVGNEPSGRSHTVSDLHVVSITGENMRKVSGNHDRTPLNLRWAPDNSGVYFDAEDQGSRDIQFAPLNGNLSGSAPVRD